MKNRWPESPWAAAAAAAAAAALIPRAVSARSAAREKSFHRDVVRESKAAGIAGAKESVAWRQNGGMVDEWETAVPKTAAKTDGVRRDPIEGTVCAKTVGLGGDVVYGCARGTMDAGS